MAANGILAFFLMAERYSTVYTYHIFFINSFVDRSFLCLGHCKQCCDEHWGACILLDLVLLWHLFGISFNVSLNETSRRPSGDRPLACFHKPAHTVFLKQPLVGM